MAADAPPKKDEASKDGKKPADAPKKEVELSEEDLAIKEGLELMVTRASDPEPGVVKLALEGMRNEIRTATRRDRKLCLVASKFGSSLRLNGAPRCPQLDDERAEAAQVPAAAL